MGVDLNRVTGEQRCALDIALELGHAQIASLLEAGGALPVQPHMLDLYGASRRGFVERVREVLDGVSDDERLRAAQAAVRELQDDCVKVIVEAGLSPEQRVQLLGVLTHSDHRRTAEQSRAMLELIAPVGLDLELRYGWKKHTVLHEAAAANTARVARFLLERGAVVNALDKDEQTPLHRAAACNGPDTTALLLEHGADHKLRDDKGHTALWITGDLSFADQEGQARIKSLLRKAGARVKSKASLLRSARKKLAAVARSAHVPRSAKKGDIPTTSETAASAFCSSRRRTLMWWRSCGSAAEAT